MKGFKDKNNKFHPITQSLGVRKSRDQKAKTEGIRFERIFQDDPDAVAKLEKKLEGLEKQKAYWKGLKPVPRTYQANEPDGAKRSFMLPNLNANIRTVRQKIKLIKSRQDRNIVLERKTTFKDGRKVFYYQEVKPDEGERKARVDDLTDRFGNPKGTQYDIVRFFSDGRRSKVVHRNVSDVVADLHTNDPRTSKEGVYFDGFRKVV